MPGTTVWIRQRRWRVESARLDENVVRLDVVDHEARRLTFLAPFDRPAVLPRRPRVQHIRPQQALARLCGLLAHAPDRRLPLAAVAARIAILPHQLEPTLAILAGTRRVLIADDVGLGKTIQAGLVIAELHRRCPSLSVLLIVPAGLMDQWTEEVEQRFAIRVRIAGRHDLAQTMRSQPSGTNPWTQRGVWLASADYVKQRHVLDAMPVRPWDLVVIDEAHHACGNSERHDACQEVACRARHVLLLTATPHSGDPVRFARLERIGRLPDLDDPLTTFRRTRAALSLPSARRVRWHRIHLTLQESKVLNALAGFEHAVLNAAGDRRRAAALLLLSVLRKRALSTMSALLVSLNRRLSWIEGHHAEESIDWLQPSLMLGDSDEPDDDDCAGLTGEIGMAAAVERTWLRRLRLLTEAARSRESKIARLVGLAVRVAEPLVVFTEFRHSLDAIDRALSRHRAVAILHGGQTSPERRVALDRFLKGGASVLVATDVAGQGLNLQARTRWVVSFELPWNPARLEQRIGRVDRIGQRQSVHATLLTALHSAEQGLLARLARRALTAGRVLGADVLGSAIAPEQDVASTLLTGLHQDPSAGPPPAIVSCRTWRRAALVIAGALARRRGFACRWRTTVAAGRPGWSHIARLPVRSLGQGETLIVLSVPILDGEGTIVERRVVCVRSDESECRRAIVVARSSAVATAAADGVERRVALIQRGRQRQLKRRIDIERAIARRLHSATCPDEVQPGLFDGGGVREFEAARMLAGDLLRDAEDRILRWTERGDVVAGLPEIELILSRP
jgi:superfamily II DNA or RNA helicase